jgi:hypothetical protein
MASQERLAAFVRGLSSQSAQVMTRDSGEWGKDKALNGKIPWVANRNPGQINKLFGSLIAIFFLLVIAAPPDVQAQTPDPGIHSQVVKLLKSIENNQYETFLEDGSEYFRSRISKQHFANVSERLGQQLKNGFDVIYLTQFKQAGLVGTLWKIEYRDGSDDALAKIFMEDGKIAGFWFQ